MKNFSALIFIPLLFVYTVAGQIPSGYYDQAAGKTGQQLQSALHEIIKGHTSVSYSGLWTAYYSTDPKPDGTVWDMYSDIPDGSPNGNPPYVFQMGSDQCGSGQSGSGEGICYTREHSFPKSWFGGEVPPMYTDLFHVIPADASVNGMRGDDPYGEVDSPDKTSQNGSKRGDCSTPGFSGIAFEPIDAFKGDLARIYFYMATRYYTEDSGWPGSDMVTGSQLKPWALAMMMQWSSADPVSQKEVNRNEAVYHIQHNRNPFVDHPEYAEQIWGNAYGIKEPLMTAMRIFPNPAKETCRVVIPKGQESDGFSIRLLSVEGKVITPEQKTGGDHILLDLNGVEKGLYILELSCSGESSPQHALLVKE